MKFLVIRRPRIGGPLVASSKMIRENKERALDLMKQGRLDCVYGIPGGGGSVSIANADSIEQLHENIAGSPLFLSSEWDIRPLTDYAKYMDGVAAALEKQGRQRDPRTVQRQLADSRAVRDVAAALDGVHAPSRTICLSLRPPAQSYRPRVAGRPLDADDTYNWFTEGFDTADLKDAKALLDELSN